jgi:hypothetical protein
VKGTNFSLIRILSLLLLAKQLSRAVSPKSSDTEAGIIVNEWGATSVSGIFAGDLTIGRHTVSHAIGWAKGALAIDAFVRGYNIEPAKSLFWKILQVYPWLS